MICKSSVSVISIYLTLSIVVSTEGASILAVVPTPSYSHQVAFYPLWTELANKGHHVTLITTDPMNIGNMTNLKQIDVSFSYDIMKKYDFSNFAKSHGGNPFKFVPRVLSMFTEILDAELSHPEIKQLINDKNYRFDVAIVEVFMPTMIAFAERFRCPLIGINSNDVFAVIHKSMGNPVHPIMYPDAIIPYDKNANLLSRLKNTIIMSAVEMFVQWIVLPKHNNVVKNHFGEDFPELEAVMKNMSLLFIAGDRFLQNVRPVGPSTIYIGGTSHIGNPKPLPMDLQSFLDDAKEGAIYFSLGSNIKSEDITVEVRKSITEVFSQLPYKVLWKLEADVLDNKSNNVKTMKWLPQHDILRHPNVKLFITQGGFQSLQEAIFSHVPMIVMPFFSDQPGNAKRILEQGLGLVIDPASLTAELFKNSILEIINNNTYQKRVKEFSVLMLDEPMTGLERAVWWTEYVLRHKGAKHLRNPAADTPFYQYHMLDIIVVFFVLSIVILCILTKMVGFVSKAIYNSFCGKMKVKTN